MGWKFERKERLTDRQRDEWGRGRQTESHSSAYKTHPLDIRFAIPNRFSAEFLLNSHRMLSFLMFLMKKANRLIFFFALFKQIASTMSCSFCRLCLLHSLPLLVVLIILSFSHSCRLLCIYFSRVYFFCHVACVITSRSVPLNTPIKSL